LLQRLHYVPRVVITDKLGSYAAAKAQVLPDAGTPSGFPRLWGYRIVLSSRSPFAGSRDYRELVRQRFTKWSEVVHPSFAR